MSFGAGMLLVSGPSEVGPESASSITGPGRVASGSGDSSIAPVPWVGSMTSNSSSPVASSLRFAIVGVDGNTVVGGEAGEAALPALTNRAKPPRPGPAVQLPQNQDALRCQALNRVYDGGVAILQARAPLEFVDLTEGGTIGACRDDQARHIVSQQGDINGHVVGTASITKNLARMHHGTITGTGLIVKDHVRIRTDPVIVTNNQRHEIDIDSVAAAGPPHAHSQAFDVRVESDILALDQHTWFHHSVIPHIQSGPLSTARSPAHRSTTRADPPGVAQPSVRHQTGTCVLYRSPSTTGRGDAVPGKTPVQCGVVPTRRLLSFVTGSGSAGRVGEQASRRAFLVLAC